MIITTTNKTFSKKKNNLDFGMGKKPHPYFIIKKDE